MHWETEQFVDITSDAVLYLGENGRQFIDLVNAAVGLVYKKKLNEAISAYQAALKLVPKNRLTNQYNFEIVHAIVSLYLQLKDPQKAALQIIAWFKVKNFGTDISFLQAAQIHHALGSYSGAIQLYQRIIDEAVSADIDDGKRLVANVGLGDVYSEQGNINKALEYYKIAIYNNLTSTFSYKFDTDKLAFVEEETYLSNIVVIEKIKAMLERIGKKPEEMLQIMIDAGIYSNLPLGVRHFAEQFPDNKHVKDVICKYIVEKLFTKIAIKDDYYDSESILSVLEAAQEFGVSDSQLKEFIEKSLFKFKHCSHIRLKNILELAQRVNVNPLILHKFLERSDVTSGYDPLANTYKLCILGNLQQDIGAFDAALCSYENAIQSAASFITAEYPELLFVVINAAQSIVSFKGNLEKTLSIRTSTGSYLVYDKQYVPDGIRKITPYETYDLMRKVFAQANVYASRELIEEISEQPNVGHIVLLELAQKTENKEEKLKLVEQAAKKLQNEIDGHGMQQLAKLYADLDKQKENQWRERALQTMLECGDLQGLLNLRAEYAVKDSVFASQVEQQMVDSLEKLGSIKSDESLEHDDNEEHMLNLIVVLLEGKKFELLKRFANVPELFRYQQQGKNTRLLYAQILEASNADGTYPNTDYMLWYRRAIELGSSEAQKWQRKLLEDNFAKDPGSLKKLEDIFVNVSKTNVIAMPVCAIINVNGQLIANTYELHDIETAERKPEPNVDGWGRKIEVVRDPISRQLLMNRRGYFFEHENRIFTKEALAIFKNYYS